MATKLDEIEKTIKVHEKRISELEKAVFAERVELKENESSKD